MADSALSQERIEILHRSAHDLRNRLSGLHQALKHVAGDNEEHRELLEFGEQQFFKAMRNIEDLMDRMGVDRTPQGLAIEKVPFVEVVKEVIENLRHRFEGKDQEVRSQFPAKDVLVAGDRHFIEEAVTALLSNASKFSPKGSPIEVELRSAEDHAELCVIDRGAGLSAEDLDRIFERYAWLGSRSSDGEPQGRSNLSRAFQWVKAMGGQLSATSEGEGKGCSFSMKLPLADRK